MVVLVTCKNIEDPINNNGAKVITTLFLDFSDAQEVSPGIFKKFNLIQAFMVGLVTCKNEEDPSNNESTRMATTFFPL